MARVKGSTRITMPMIARMEQLRDVDLSYKAIARVMTLDLGIQIAPGQVQYHLKRPGRVPRERSKGLATVRNFNPKTVENLNR